MKNARFENEAGISKTKQAFFESVRAMSLRTSREGFEGLGLQSRQRQLFAPEKSSGDVAGKRG